MDKSEYLNISKAADIQNKKERVLYRFLETIPGLISLGTLLGVLVFSWLLPSWVAIFIISFCLYYLLRVLYFSLHQITGYFKIKKHMARDWLKELRKINSKNNLESMHPKRDWKKIYHLVILPAHKEGPKIIRESLESLVNSNYPKEKLIVVLTVEERAGKKFKETAKKIESEYCNKFSRFIAVTHPDNISGEIAGKGSNIAYAGKKAKDRIIDVLKIPYENIIVSTFDIDTRIYPQYFSCLTWYYLTQKNPHRASYQPVPVYNNNVWEASFLARVVSCSNTFWQIIQQERPEKLITYSSHAIPGKVFFEIGYPSNVVSDDSRIFWRAYFHYNGDYRVVPIYYFVSMDAVDSPNIFKTILNQYRQQKRWAWGCSEIPYAIFGFLRNKKIPLWQKISHLYTLIDGYWSWATAALLLFLLGWLPIFLGGEKFNFSILSFNLPILTSRIMTIALIGMFVSAILSTLLLPSTVKEKGWTKKSAIFLQWIFLPVTLIIFGSLPALDAQIRLMLGKYMGFWVTEKVRKY